MIAPFALFNDTLITYNFILFYFQGLTIIAFNDGHLNSKTLREVLSLGPTFVVMKFFESKFHMLPKLLLVISLS
jgi:callose synthase